MDKAMLSLQHNPHSGEVRLLIQTGLAEAWISRHPPLLDRHDWLLRVRLSPREPVLSRRTPTGLLVESHLRFAEFRLIAERAEKHPTPRRRVGLE